MVRFVALLGAVSLLVCQSAGLDAADVEEQDEFNKPYAPDSSVREQVIHLEFMYPVMKPWVASLPL